MQDAHTPYAYRTGDRMFGWILKTDWDIEDVMEVYSRKRRRLARLSYLVPRRVHAG